MEQQPGIDIIPLFEPGNGVKDLDHYASSLRQSELRYNQLVENLQAAIYTTDAEGHITLYNKAAADLWGREPTIGKDMWCGSYKIYDTDGADMPLDTCSMARVLKEGRPILGEEIIVVRPDGAFRNVAPQSQPLFDENGKIIGAVNMLVDITGIRQSEHALRESEKQLMQLNSSLEKKVEERTADLNARNEELKRSEERYHKMIDEVEDYAIVLLDQTGIILNWNKGAEKIKGYREDEIVGKSFSTFYMEEDRRKGLPLNLLAEARTNGKAIHEGWRLRKDGTIFWGSIVITALHDAEKNIVGFSKVTRDLTARKKAEDKMIEYTKRLEFQNKELEQFAYAASHDMKEPLRKISFYNNFIRQDPSLQLNKKASEYLTRSLSAVKRMSKLIDDLLTYSKTNAANESVEQTDLNEIVEEIAFSHKEMLEAKEVMIEVGKLPMIPAIPFQIKQLMDNIINNSIKYKYPGRKCIIKINSKLIQGSDIDSSEAEPGSQYHQIIIEDNGIGFEAQYAEKIFDIFQRLTNGAGHQGSGVGLAICKKIVQNHRGIIKAVAIENEGARFDIFMPVINN
ncbi:MAG: PAS domain S-box protein [Ferruginibacter sp.]